MFKEHVAAGGHVQGLLQVCRHWHNLTIHDPRLWTFIVVDAEKVDALMDNSASQGISVQLARSEDLPLHISVSDSAQLPHREDKLPRKSNSWVIFAAIWRHSHRWGRATLKLDLSLGGAGQHIYDPTQEPAHFPLLRALTVEASATPNDHPIFIDEMVGALTLSKFQNTPSLSSLRIPAITFANIGGELPLFASKPFPPLGFVSVKRCDQYSLFRWLEYTRGSLATFEVESIYQSSFVPLPTSKYLVLPSLDSLRLPLPQGGITFLNRLEVPNLKTLILHLDPDEGRAHDVASIPDLIARSDCRPERIEIFVPETVPSSDIRALFPQLGLEETEYKEGRGVKKIYFIRGDSG
ncbi:hypothetical protein PQX77_001497 [Marasmius sp. AFHP31]|nr:hypothetical protein PQX77_001497 [Marasmius sp. AFHP31]